MANPTIKFVFFVNPDGSRTEIESVDFFGCTSPRTSRWNTPDKERFHEERVAIEKGEVKYICGRCLNPVVIRGGREEEGVTMHFRHKGDAPKDCPFEDNRTLSEQQIRAFKYKGLQESERHERLKSFIASIFENKGFEVAVEKVLNINHNQFRRPDVLVYDPLIQKHIVFEIQMSTTFLHVIVERMRDYSSIDYPVIWIFNKFKPEEYTTKDTYQFQNYNVFILDDEMMQLSLKNGMLTLKVYYLEYEDIGESNPKSKWKNRIVTLADLVFDSKNGVYYYDSKSNRNQVITKIENRERFHLYICRGLSKMKSLDSLATSEIDALCSSTGENIDRSIEEAIQEGLYGKINPQNIYSLFQCLEILKKRRLNSMYNEVKSIVRKEIVKQEIYNDCHISVWDGFNVLSHSSIIEDIPFISSIYRLGYRPECTDAETIEETMMAEYRKTQRDKKSTDAFQSSLTHYFLLKIALESSNIEEQKELLNLYRENYRFISCVVAITMRRFVGHNFTNLTGFCNYVWNHCNCLCRVFLRIIDNSKIDVRELISKKGVDHYAKIKMQAQSQGISPSMDRLMSILIPKVWNK